MVEAKSTNTSGERANHSHIIKKKLAMRSSGFTVMLVIALVVMSHGARYTVEAQVQSTCSSSLSTLNVCTPFVVPGASAAPSTECCGALQAVTHDCLCSTLRIASRIPVQCNLPPLNCAN